MGAREQRRKNQLDTIRPEWTAAGQKLIVRPPPRLLATAAPAAPRPTRPDCSRPLPRVAPPARLLKRAFRLYIPAVYTCSSEVCVVNSFFFFRSRVQNKCFRSRIGFSCLSSLVCRKLTVVTKKNGTFSSEWHRPPGVDAGCRCGGQAPVGGRCGRMWGTRGCVTPSKV